MDPKVKRYFAALPPQTRRALQQLREVVRAAAPGAEEVSSYGIVGLKLDGRSLVWYAGFKNHIGMFPPVRGDARLLAALKRYQGPKGNLRFPLTEPMPLALITRLGKLRVKQDLEKAKNRRN